MSERNFKGKRKKGLLSDERPSFFKILLPNSNDSLEIPEHFMSKTSEKDAKVAVLKGPKSISRDIRLSFEREGGLYMRDGWKEFLDENDLANTTGLLIFRYNGDMQFDVKAFDGSGSEILDIESVAGTTHEFTNYSSGKRKRGRPKKTSVACLDLPQPSSENSSDDEILHTESNLQEIQKKVRTQKPTVRKDSSKLKEAEEGGNHEIINRSNKRVEVSVKGLAQDEVGENMLKAVKAFTSRFPFFDIRIRKYHVNTIMILTIPRDFTIKNFKRYNKNFNLKFRNHEGKHWVVNVVTDKLRRIYKFSGGWRSFVLDNKIKADDICIFELVAQQEMQVHIFRAMDQVGSALSS